MPFMLSLLSLLCRVVLPLFLEQDMGGGPCVSYSEVIKGLSQAKNVFPDLNSLISLTHETAIAFFLATTLENVS